MTATLEQLPEAVPQGVAAQKPASLWRDTLKNILRQRSAIVGSP